MNDLEYWKKKLRSKSFPSAPVNTIREAFEHEQSVHLDLVKTVEHPKYGKVKVVGKKRPIINAISIN
jgi:crotonobetainyl-CoA:carnitine CoA-transferase CaiB-like acyl-CoA transferase